MEPAMLDFEKPLQEIESMLQKLRKLAAENKGDFSDQIRDLEERAREQRSELFSNLSAWQTVQIARHPARPVLKDYIAMICDHFMELHGDRRVGDDRALVGGLATIGGKKVMLIGHNRGKNVEENIRRNFGSARPEGYRKAMRLMTLAAKMRIPVVSLIDTSGAFPGKDAEERGQAEAIARNLAEMSQLPVPVVVVVTGEGGSGGAIGIGIGDQVFMLQHAIYSVISPEGCAAILWRDSAKAPEAAEALKLTAESLKKLGIIDEIIPEPLGGAHKDPVAAAENLKARLLTALKSLSRVSSQRLVHRRFEKLSKIGVFDQ